MGRKLHYKMGSFYRVDDFSGFPQRAENTKQLWTGLIVDSSLWESRNAQDFVKGVKDDQSVPKPRPLPPNIFDGPSYYSLVDAIGPGSEAILLTEADEYILLENGVEYLFGGFDENTLALDTVFGITLGDSGGVMMDNGEFYNFTFQAILTGNLVIISGAVPYPTSVGNQVVNYTTHIPALPYANLSTG